MGVKRAQIEVVIKMGSKTIVEEKKIEETIKNISEDWFTVLDFTEVFGLEYPEEWKRLVERIGLFGRKRRYTVATYFSNRLDVYSQKPYSILVQSRDITKESLGTTEEPQRKKGKFLEAHG